MTGLTLLLLLSCTTLLPVKCETGELVLTPWWNIELAEGEQLQVDCGFQDDGNGGRLKWLHPSGNSLPTETGDANGYRIETLSIASVQFEHIGTYTCAYTPSTNESQHEVVAIETNITVVVVPADSRLNFEKTILGNWKHDGWTLRSSTDDIVKKRNIGPKFDHTYGPAKSFGSFIEVDTEGLKQTTHAHLTTPIYDPNSETSEQCLQFWHFSDAKTAQLLVRLNSSTAHNNQIEENLTILATTDPENSASRWKKLSVPVPKQESEYTLILDAVLCKDQENRVTACGSGILAIDDIKFVEGPCDDDDDDEEDFGMHDVNLEYRLAGSSVPWYGRLELLHDGQYGSVCSATASLSSQEKSLICQGLGYSYPPNDEESSADYNLSPTNNGAIWISGLHCTSDSERLDECLQESKMWGNVVNCTHADDVIIMCSSNSPAPPLAGTKKNTDPTPTSTTQVPSQPVSSDKSPTKTSTPTATPSSTSIPSATESDTATAMVTESASKPAATTPVSVLSTTSKNTTLLTFITKHRGSRHFGKGILIGLGIIIILSIAAFVLILVKGRKRRRRKSKYLNFGTTSYSREHLPTNEFHLQSPLTMSSMGYTVLA